MEECNFIQKDDYDYIIYECSNCKEEWYFEYGTPEDNSSIIIALNVEQK